MTNAESQKARRDRARAAGMCLVCTKQPTADGLSTCVACTVLKRVWNRANAADGMGQLWQQRSEERAARRPLPPDHFNVCCQAHYKHRVGCVAA